MKWTREKPTVADTWWWYRDLPGGEALRVAHVICDRSLGWVVFFDGSEVDQPLEDCIGEWAGPLVPPGAIETGQTQFARDDNDDYRVPRCDVEGKAHTHYGRRDYLRDVLLCQLATVILAKELRTKVPFEFPKEAVDALRAFRDVLPETLPDE